MNRIQAAQREISFGLIVGAGVLFQAISIPSLWGHASNSGELFGRYTLRYGIALIAQLILIPLWLIAYWQRNRLERWIKRQHRNWRYGLFALILLAVIGSSFLSIEAQVREYSAVNLVLIGLILVWHDPPQIPAWILPAAAVLALPLLLITVLITFPFSPDEAQWADYASTAITHGGVYAETWLQPPYRIYPGHGWDLAGYGWILEHVSFDIRAGRLWNFTAYLLAFAGIAALANQLYGRRAALVSAAFSVLSLMFIPVFDFRPDHQIAFACVWVVFATARGHFSRHRLWDGLAGLLAVMALELHAIAIALAFGLGLYYLLSFLYHWWREHRIEAAPLIWYAGGALIGAGIYFVLNVLPVGGLNPYLQSLVSERFGGLHGLYFLNLPSLFEGALILASLAFLIWRRQAADRFLLGVIVCLWIGLFIFDTEGYYHSVMIGLYAVGVGALIVEGFEQHHTLAAARVTAVLIAQISTFISWDGIAQAIKQRSLPNYVYADVGAQIKPYLRSGDKVLSTHLMIWSLHDAFTLYTTDAELTGMKRWQLTDPEQVWERVQPTVYIDIKNQVDPNPGVQAYLTTHKFQVCQQLTFSYLQISIERPVC